VCRQAKAKTSKAAPGKVQVLLKGAVEGVGKDGKRLYYSWLARNTLFDAIILTPCHHARRRGLVDRHRSRGFDSRSTPYVCAASPLCADERGTQSVYTQEEMSVEGKLIDKESVHTRRNRGGQLRLPIGF
jgi:hypothetical protein